MPLATRLSSKPAAPVEEEKVPELPAEEPQQASPKPAFRSPLKDALVRGWLACKLAVAVWHHRATP